MSEATGKHAYGFCDRTGFRYPLKDLVEEYVRGVPTGRRVGRDMVDPDHPQNWVGEAEVDDPKPLNDPRPDTSLRESRRMFSFNPVGVGNLEMQGSVGRVVAS